MATVDTHELARLADDLDAVPAEKRPEIRKVVERGALNIKNGLRQDAAGHPTYRLFPLSISFDMTGEFEAEIGPDKSRVQGPLGNILYFGTSKNAPQLDLESPLRRETQRFVDYLADVAEDIL
ncbi:hypothetical protein [Amycolatopsis kentuckyensis]|uniref:hypothetical protein n=1 Tax=Amycolatopsis kentuckyensis TaxID=218823 RepID=UPI00356634D4